MRTIDRLKSLSAAEEFFGFLGVPYDPSLLNVMRLHILKRMAERLRAADLSELSDTDAFDLARLHLQRAYADFEASSPLKERVFKVLREADPAKPKSKAGAKVVPLSALTLARAGA
jgi:nitrogenase-stabilizing/protective protein